MYVDRFIDKRLLGIDKRLLGIDGLWSWHRWTLVMASMDSGHGIDGLWSSWRSRQRLTGFLTPLFTVSTKSLILLKINV